MSGQWLKGRVRLGVPTLLLVATPVLFLLFGNAAETKIRRYRKSDGSYAPTPLSTTRRDCPSRTASRGA